MMPRKLERLLAVFDTHGDHADPKTIDVILRFKKAWKPDLIIHGGDAFDFRRLRVGASEEERRESMGDDLAMGCDFLEKLKPHVWTRGNHCERIYLAAKSTDGDTRRLACQDIETIHKSLRGDVKIIPYNKRKVFRYADTNIFHGFYGGVNAAMQTARAYGKSIAGHVHRPDVASVPSLDRATCYLSGAGCRLNADYNARQPGTLAQQAGFIFGVKLHGSLTIYSATCEKGIWLLPTGFEAFQV
jgi:predicted phosphodiesterase